MARTLLQLSLRRPVPPLRPARPSHKTATSSRRRRRPGSTWPPSAAWACRWPAWPAPAAARCRRSGGLFGGGAGGARTASARPSPASTGRWVDVTLYSAQQPVAGRGAAGRAGRLHEPGAETAGATRRQGAAARPTMIGRRTELRKAQGQAAAVLGLRRDGAAGQPKVLDMASASAADLAAFFVSRRATQRGAHSATGRPVWPNPADARMVPDDRVTGRRACLQRRRRARGLSLPDSGRTGPDAAAAAAAGRPGRRRRLRWNAAADRTRLLRRRHAAPAARTRWSSGPRANCPKPASA